MAVDFPEGELVLHISSLSKWGGEENMQQIGNLHLLSAGIRKEVHRSVEGTGRCCSSTWGQTKSQASHWNQETGSAHDLVLGCMYCAQQLLNLSELQFPHLNNETKACPRYLLGGK